MDSKLIDLFKRYVTVFLKEYSNILDYSQKEILNNINYDKIIHFDNIAYPNGAIYLDQIYFPDCIDELIDTMHYMPLFGNNKKFDNKHYTGYLEHMCRTSYSEDDYYIDHLMYMIFKLVIKEDNSFINGLINYEIVRIGRKYHLKFINLYEKEMKVVLKMSDIFDEDCFQRILFMDKISSFKYLSEHKGFSYANLVYDISNTMRNLVSDNNYYGVDGIINYARDYDSLAYGDVYNELLDFKVENSL